jgi:hypothetical protein
MTIMVARDRPSSIVIIIIIIAIVIFEVTTYHRQ